MAETKQRKMEGWKLRRLGPRALSVLERHKASDAVLAAFEPTLVPAVQRHIALYEEMSAVKAGRTTLLGDGETAVTKLHERTQAWLLLVGRDVSRVERQDYLSSASVPDDVIAASRRMLALVTRRSSELAYADALTTELSALLAQAEQAANGFDGSLVAEQALRAELRAASHELHELLLLFRRAVKRLLGAEHRDCKRLRIRPKRKAEGEDGVEGNVGDEDEDADLVDELTEVNAQGSVPIEKSHLNGASTHA